VVGRPGRRGRVISRLALGLCGVVALLLSACGPGTAGSAPLAQSQVFTWPYYGTANLMHGEVLDPATLVGAEDTGTLDMIYSGLVTFNSALQVQPDAATWEVDNTGTVYTFHLKQNLHFSDGTPLTASDFAYSINRATDPTLCTTQDAKTYGPPPGGTGECTLISTAYLGLILGAMGRLNTTSGPAPSLIGKGDDPTKGVDVLDPYTLRIRLAHPASYFLEALTYPTSYPVEQSLVNKYPGGLWVDHLNEGGCSGPFMIKSYGGGTRLTLVPNPYWATAYGKKLTLTEVVRPVYQSVDDEYAAYRAGQNDYTDVPGKEYTFARGQDDFNEVPTLYTMFFGLNFDKPPFDSVLVRRAFDLALNKQLLVDRIFNGGAIPTNHIVPRGMPGYNESLVNPPPDGTQSLTGNQAAAVTLIQQVVQECKAATVQKDYCPYVMDGASSQEIDITYDSTTQTDQDVTTAAAQMWAAVLGLNVKAKGSGVDQNTYFGNLGDAPNVPYQAWNVAWIADYPDPQDWLSLQFATGAVDNSEDVHDPQLDALLQAADRDLNQADRMAKYNQAEQDVVNLVGWIPYAQGKAFWRQRLWVRGFGLNSLYTMVDVNWPNVYIVQH
jgi:oligopeptide transport system substrate-binding protein